jgi:hypothetical protein
MLVLQAEQGWPRRSPPAGASHDTLLDHAFTGHIDAVAASTNQRQPRPNAEAAVSTPRACSR